MSRSLESHIRWYFTIQIRFALFKAEVLEPIQKPIDVTKQP